MIFGSVFHIIKHSRIQCVLLLAVSTAFLGALSSVNSSNRGSAAAFSFLAALPAGVLELIPGILIQLEADDVDLGTVFGMEPSILFFKYKTYMLTPFFSHYLLYENCMGINFHSSLRGDS